MKEFPDLDGETAAVAVVDARDFAKELEREMAEILARPHYGDDLKRAGRKCGIAIFTQFLVTGNVTADKFAFMLFDNFPTGYALLGVNKGTYLNEVKNTIQRLNAITGAKRLEMVGVI